MSAKLAIALLAVAVFLPLSFAQQLRGPAITIPVPRPPISSFAALHGPGVRFGERGAMGRFRQDGFATPFVYSDYPYSGYSAAPATEVAPQPQVVVVQMPALAEAAKEAPPHALLIELQGNHYVQVGGNSAVPDHSPSSSPDKMASAATRPATRGELSAPLLAPVVLIYRDGRQEEIENYTIADGVIYARGDYWTDGYWNKKIELTALNIPASMKASQDRGAKFVLPGSPNEVIIRP